MEALLALDQTIFLLFNHLPHTVLLDEIARFFSGIGTWGAVWIGIVFIFFLREEKKDHTFFLPALFVSAGAIFSEFVLKVLVARPRPTVEMGALIIESADNFSFPSSHAFFAFAFAYLLSHMERRCTVWFYLLAICIALSRIYLGVHYPLDIIVGALLGWATASASFALLHRR
jgi:undecaprenyl-diphosphatase